MSRIFIAQLPIDPAKLVHLPFQRLAARRATEALRAAIAAMSDQPPPDNRPAPVWSPRDLTSIETRLFRPPGIPPLFVAKIPSPRVMTLDEPGAEKWSKALIGALERSSGGPVVDFAEIAEACGVDPLPLWPLAIGDFQKLNGAIASAETALRAVLAQAPFRAQRESRDLACAVRAVGGESPNPPAVRPPRSL